jgi:hypothetical protein
VENNSVEVQEGVRVMEVSGQSAFNVAAGLRRCTRWVGLGARGSGLERLTPWLVLSGMQTRCGPDVRPLPAANTVLMRSITMGGGWVGGQPRSSG